jgi:hypothetical protein
MREVIEMTTTGDFMWRSLLPIRKKQQIDVYVYTYTQIKKRANGDGRRRGAELKGSSTTEDDQTKPTNKKEKPF